MPSPLLPLALSTVAGTVVVLFLLRNDIRRALHTPHDTSYDRRDSASDLHSAAADDDDDDNNNNDDDTRHCAKDSSNAPPPLVAASVDYKTLNDESNQPPRSVSAPVDSEKVLETSTADNASQIDPSISAAGLINRSTRVTATVPTQVNTDDNDSNNEDDTASNVSERHSTTSSVSVISTAITSVAPSATVPGATTHSMTSATSAVVLQQDLSNHADDRISHSPKPQKHNDTSSVTSSNSLASKTHTNSSTSQSSESSASRSMGLERLRQRHTRMKNELKWVEEQMEALALADDAVLQSPTLGLTSRNSSIGLPNDVAATIAATGFGDDSSDTESETGLRHDGIDSVAGFTADWSEVSSTVSHN